MAYETPCQPESSIPSETCGCKQDGCEKVGYQYADISVPVELKSDASIGEVTVECCGEPCVNCRECDCGDACEIVVTQKVNIRIPVHYQVTACMGDSTMNCDCGGSCCQ